MVIKHLELFSGIGGFRNAFDHLSRDFGFKTKCVGFSEIDENAIKSYVSNFEVSDKENLGDIVSFVSNKKRLNSLQNFSWLTGGFPCQAFSMMGKQQGFKDIRGNVFFQIIEILKVKKPKYILLENVRNLLSHNSGETFKTIVKFIKEAGYPYVYYDIFNTADFGLAQKRNRVYIFATNVKPSVNFEFSADNRTAVVPDNSPVSIRMAQFSLRRIRLNRSNFIQALTDKLYWGEDVRNNM